MDEVNINKRLKIILTFALNVLFLCLIVYDVANQRMEAVSPYWFTLLFPNLLGYLIANMANKIKKIKLKGAVILFSITILTILHAFSFILIVKSMKVQSPTPIIQNTPEADITKYYWGTNCGSCLLTLQNNEKYFSSNNVQVYLSYRDSKDSLNGRWLLTENTNLDANKMKFLTSSEFYKSGNSSFPIVEIYRGGTLKYQGFYITKWCLSNKFVCSILAL